MIKPSYRLTVLGFYLALSAVGVSAQNEGQSAARPSAASSPPAASSPIAEAQAHLSAGRIDAAISALQAITGSAADGSQISHLLGLAHYQKGDHARAIDYLSAALKQSAAESPQRHQSIELIGRAHYMLGHLKEAIPYFEQTRKWMPDNPEIAYALGIAYIQTHNTERSRDTFAHMFRIEPGSASAHLINAQMMIRQQFEEFAEKELQKASQLDPRLPQVNFLLGELAIYRAQIDRGIELLQKEIAINPAFGMAYYRLGEAYTRQLKWDEATAPLQKSIWLNPFFSGPYIVLGKIYLKKGNLETAEDMLKRALQMDPNNSSAHHLLAQALQQSNRPEEARKEFEQAERLRTLSNK